MSYGRWVLICLGCFFLIGALSFLINPLLSAGGVVLLVIAVICFVIASQWKEKPRPIGPLPAYPPPAPTYYPAPPPTPAAPPPPPPPRYSAPATAGVARAPAAIPVATPSRPPAQTPRPTVPSSPDTRSSGSNMVICSNANCRELYDASQGPCPSCGAPAPG